MKIMNAEPPHVLANVGPGSVAGQLQLMARFCNKKERNNVMTAAAAGGYIERREEEKRETHLSLYT